MAKRKNLVTLSRSCAKLPAMWHILLVEDDSATASTLKIFLEDEGFGVDVATNVTEAIQHMKRHYPDLIVLDYYLNGCVGSKLIPYIHRSVPILLVTAATKPGEVARECGLDFYIQKPFELENFVSAIRAFLKKK